MTALATARKAVRRDGRQLNEPVAAGVVILAGALVIMAGGFARPGRTGQGGDDTIKANDAATYRAAGVAVESVTGGGADGDVRVNLETGVWCFVNSAGVDAITLADLNRVCFIVDDQTVAKTSASGIRAPAGRIVDVDAEGVWVDVGAAGVAGGSRSVFLPFVIPQTELLAPTSIELVSPVAGRIARLTTVVQTAVTTGGDITAAVGVTAVVGLACTVPDAAAKGSVVTDTPTAGDASTVVAVGSRIQIVPGAPFNTAGAVSGVLEIQY